MASSRKPTPKRAKPKKTTNTTVLNPAASRLPRAYREFDRVPLIAGQPITPEPVTAEPRPKAGEIIESAPGVVVVNPDPRLQRGNF